MKEMVVILYNIRSMHNVGSIFRTADAIGCKKIYLCGITSAPVDRFGNPRSQLVKVSLGAEKSVEWEKVGAGTSVRSTLSLIKKLKKENYKIFSIEQSKESISHYKAYSKNTKQKIVLILGNEVNGLPDSISKLSDKILEIPMNGEKHSLNVAVAFGVVAYSLSFK